MTQPTRRAFTVSALSLATALASPASRANGFPERPIRLIVPYAPGGGSDFVGRLIAQKLSETAGWTVVVDNKAGASGLIGTDAVAKSPADGYTLLLADAAHALNAAVQPKLPFDSLKDLLALSREQSRKFAVGTSGQGSAANLLYELLKLKTGLELVHVPYKGGGAALTDAIAGQIPLVINSVPACMPHIQAKKLKVLAIASSAPDARFPGVQTFADSAPGVTGSTWYGVMAPARTPADAQQRLTAAIVKVMDLPEFKAKMTEAYIDPSPRGPQAFAQRLAAEVQQWQSVVTQTGFKLNG